MLLGQPNLCWWIGKTESSRIRSYTYDSLVVRSRLLLGYSAASLYRFTGEGLRFVTNRLYWSLFSTRKQYIPDALLPNRILVRGPKNHNRLPQRCFSNPKDFDAIHQGTIRQLKGDRDMVAGPTAQASGKLCLLGGFQKSAFFFFNTSLPPMTSNWVLLLYWTAMRRISKDFVVVIC